MTDKLDEKSVWDQIDAVPVINLDNRPDRWARMLETTGDLFPPGKLARFSASFGKEIPGFGTLPWFRGRPTDSRWAARAGCTLSHRRVVEEATKHGWHTVLILEDDADFSIVDAEEFVATLRNLLADRESWDVCYLGYSKSTGPARMSGSHGNREYLRVSGCATTHAYLINSKARDWLMQNLPPEQSIWRWTAKHRIIDRWYAWNLSKHLKVLAISPAIIPQTEGFSDIVQQEVDYTSDFPGLVTRKQTHRSHVGYIGSRLIWHLRYHLSLMHDSIRYLRKKKKGF